MIEHADEQTGTTALTVATYTDALESGYYLLSGSISFKFRTDNAYFPLSKVHEMFASKLHGYDQRTPKYCFRCDELVCLYYCDSKNLKF